ncbi:MAG: hypothetical protein ABSH34_11615, partial [Verrucomicrobiota bacterium]
AGTDVAPLAGEPRRGNRWASEGRASLVGAARLNPPRAATRLPGASGRVAATLDMARAVPLPRWSKTPLPERNASALDGRSARPRL